MSGILSAGVAAFTAGLDGVNALASLAFGAFGGVVLGDFVFSGMEVPASIAFGGKQAMTTHRLPGGERVVDLMGPDDQELSWSGLFIDNLPSLRAQQLDQMRAAGEPLPLVWGEFCYTVIISSFSADTRYSQVPYRISCLVLRNEATAPPDGADAPDLTSATTDDMESAAEASPAAVLAPVTAAQTALAGVGTLTPGAPSLAVAGGLVTQAQGAVSGLQATAETEINGLIAAAPANGIVANPAALLSAVSSAGTLAQLQQTAGYLNRVASNITP